MYYIQSIFPEVIKALGIDYKMASMIYTISLIGNASSLIFITPLGDFINRKKLISVLYLILSIASLTAYISNNIWMMYVSAYFLGVGVAIIPITISYLSTNKNFGVEYIGKIMSGVLLGALISRFISSEFSIWMSWNSIYLFSSMMMFLSLICIGILLPNDNKKSHKKNLSYNKLILGTFSLFINDKNVRKFSLYGFFVMAIFSSFWNNISIYLFGNYHLNQSYIGVFSLTGIAGATAAMFANNILKKINYKSNLIFLVIFISFLILIVAKQNLILLAVSSIIIDAMIQLIHVNNQTKMYSNCKGYESRAASCYMTTFIIGGVIGSKLSSYLYVLDGWQGVCIMCSLISVLCIIFSREKN